MKKYATRSYKLTITLTVEGVKRNIVFTGRITDKNFYSYSTSNKAEQEALEKLPSFTKSFWIFEVNDEVIEEKKEEEPKDTTNYPEVKTLQEARLKLMELNPDLKPTSINAPVAIFKRAEELKITFSNLK